MWGRLSRPRVGLKKVAQPRTLTSKHINSALCHAWRQHQISCGACVSFLCVRAVRDSCRGTCFDGQCVMFLRQHCSSWHRKGDSAPGKAQNKAGLSSVGVRDTYQSITQRNYRYSLGEEPTVASPAPPFSSTRQPDSGQLGGLPRPTAAATLPKRRTPGSRLALLGGRPRLEGHRQPVAGPAACGEVVKAVLGVRLQSVLERQLLRMRGLGSVGCQLAAQSAGSPHNRPLHACASTICFSTRPCS